MPPPTNKVIISCALTGGIHTPTMSPALPVSPDMLAEQGVAASQAGAAVLHVHARDPRDGRPTPDPAAYMAFLPRLKAECEAIINVTTGGGLNMTVDDRLKAPLMLRPEMCSLNMGSMNFGIYPLADRYQSWKYEWEEPYLRATEDAVFKNTFRDIARIVSVLGQGHGCRFEHECYDVGHLYNLAHMVDRKIVQPPFFVQMIFGVLGGIGSDLVKPDVHEADGGSPLWIRLRLVGARGRTPADAVCRAIRAARWIGARRTRGFALHQPGHAGQLECRTGDQGPIHHRSAGLRDRHAG